MGDYLNNQIQIKRNNFNQNNIQFENHKKSSKSDDNLKKAARDFEAIFITQILRNMRRSISESNLFGGSISGDIYKRWDRHRDRPLTVSY